MNREVRKKEMIKISLENQAILRRLQSKKATYDTSKLNEDFRQRSKIVTNLCEHPFILDGLKPKPKTLNFRLWTTFLSIVSFSQGSILGL